MFRVDFGTCFLNISGIASPKVSVIYDRYFSLFFFNCVLGFLDIIHSQMLSLFMSILYDEY